MKTIKERFESQFETVPESGCWIWTSYNRRDNYGNFKIGNKTFLAHRVSYELYIGIIPHGMDVLHRCDIPSCVNPYHFFLGTQIDNVRDCWKKGRGFVPAVRGERQAHAKLKEKDIIKIRQDSRPQSQIAKDYGVSQSVIGDVKRLVTWKHI